MTCPDCGEEELVTSRRYTWFAAYVCGECEQEWEEDTSNQYHYKSVGFSGTYEGYAEARRAYQTLGHQIPRGWELHHIDHDSSNNSLGNLIAVPKSAHSLIHDSPSKYTTRSAIQALVDNLQPTKSLRRL